MAKNTHEQLYAKLVAYSLSLVAGITYLICAFLFAVFPRGMMYATTRLFHSFDMMAIARSNMMLGNVVFGLVVVMVTGLLAGWLFAKVYNGLLGKVR